MASLMLGILSFGGLGRVREARGEVGKNVSHGMAFDRGGRREGQIREVDQNQAEGPGGCLQRQEASGWMGTHGRHVFAWRTRAFLGPSRKASSNCLDGGGRSRGGQDAGRGVHSDACPGGRRLLGNAHCGERPQETASEPGPEGGQEEKVGGGTRREPPWQSRQGPQRWRKGFEGQGQPRERSLFCMEQWSKPVCRNRGGWGVRRSH